MTFEEWWYHGCRYGEREPHKFASDMPSDAWLAKEAWQAASENAEALKPSHNNASDAMRRFDDVDIENLSDYDMAWTARIIVREYRAALTRIA